MSGKYHRIHTGYPQTVMHNLQSAVSGKKNCCQLYLSLLKYQFLLPLLYHKLSDLLLPLHSVRSESDLLLSVHLLLSAVHKPLHWQWYLHLLNCKLHPMLPVHPLLPVLHKPDLLLPGLLLPVPDLHNHSGSEGIRSMPDSVLPILPAQLLTVPDTVFPAHPAMPGMLPLLLQFLLLLPRVSHPVEDRMHS